MMAIDPAPHVIGRHSSKTALNANWAQVAALEDRVEVLEASPGSSAFTDLTDTPSAYTGSALKVVRVNAAETALEFATSAGGGDMLAANNLSDLADKATARTNLGLAIGTDVQAYDADLTTWAGVTRAAGFDTFVATPSSANLASLVTGETGSGALVFGTSPGFTTAANPVSNDGAALGTTALKWSDLFLADGGVINWNNGDVAIVHSTDALTFSGAGSGYLFDNFVAPSVNDGAVLGSTSLKWSDLFLASGAVINFNSGDVTITHSSNALAFAGAASGYSFDAALSVGSNTVLGSGILTMNLANSGIELGSSTANTPFIDFHSSANVVDYDVRLIASGGSASIGTGLLTINASAGVGFTGTPFPITDDGAALGGTGNRWSDLYLAPGAVINFASSDVTLTHSTDALTFGGAANGYLFDNTIRPVTNDVGSLGIGTVSWADLFLASGGVINFANGNYTLTHSTGVLSTSGPISLGGGADGATPTPRLTFGSYADNAGAVSVSHIDLWGGAYGFGISGNQLNYIVGSGAAHAFYTGASLSSILFAISGSAATFNVAAVPGVNDGAALGNTSLMWSDLFLASGAVLNFNNGNVTITHSANALAITASSGVTINAKNMLFKDLTGTISVGYNLTPYSIGTFASTFTPDPANGNYQYGTHDSTNITAFNVPGSDCAIDILITNSGTAGSIVFSGYTVGSNTGDTLTTATGNKFIVSIRRINGVSTYTIKALQ